MNVYILTIDDGWNSNEMVGVFQSQNSAEQYIIQNYFVQDDDSDMPNDNGKISIQSYSIIEYEVIK